MTNPQVDLSPDDAAEYRMLEDESRALVGRHLEEDTLVRDYTNILVRVTPGVGHMG